MAKKFKILLILITLLIIGVFPIRGDETRILLINREFFQKLIQTPLPIRDEFIDEKLANKIISGKGKILSTNKAKRFKKNYCINLTDMETNKLHLNITYHLYTSDKEVVSLLTADSIFEFSGLFMGATPLNTKRDSYIFDIILEKGALIVE